MSNASKEKKSIFASTPRRLSAEEILKVAGGGPLEAEDYCKSGSGQDNQAKPGFC